MIFWQVMAALQSFLYQFPEHGEGLQSPSVVGEYFFYWCAAQVVVLVKAIEIAVGCDLGVARRV